MREAAFQKDESWDTGEEVTVVASRPGRPRKTAADPLSPDDLARCELVARRLHSELRRLVAGLPAHARAASGMARHLGIVRNTCQRVVASIAEPAPSPGLLARVPGIEGLQQFVEAARRSGADKGDTAAAQAAVEQFHGLLRELGGSQSRLAERLRAGPERAPDDLSVEPALCDEQARRQLFQGAAQCTGRHCDVSSSIYIFRPVPGDESERERALLHAVIGHRSRAQAMPFTVSAFVPRDDGKSAAPAPPPPLSLLDSSPAHGSSEHSLVTEFSSSPLPTVTTRDDQGELITIIDPGSASDPRRPIDVVLANRSRHRPTAADLAGKPLRDVWKLVNVPCRYLILDVYLHRSLAAACVPSVDVLMWNPNLDAPHRWAMRFPGGPRLELLGSGLRHASCPAFGRQADLTAYGFRQLGWAPDDFIGFRCETSFPVWRAGYCMSFNAIA